MIRTQLSSLTYIRNWRVILVYFLIIPLLNMMLLVAVTGTSSGEIDWRVASNSILISGALLAIGSMSGLLVDDLNRGISIEVVVLRPFSLGYWGSKVLATSLVAEIMILINGILLWIVHPQLVLINLLILSPLSVISGVILGITASIASWGMDDPYFFTNIITTIGYIVSGTLVSLDKYPKWLAIIGKMFPFGNTIGALESSKLFNSLGDVPIMIIWLVLGIIIYLWKIKTITKESKQRTIL